MIFVDSNIPMYLIGATHPHKTDAARLLQRSAADGLRLVTDAEVFQEILHRYVAIDRRDAIQPAFELLSSIVDEVLEIDIAIVERARDLVLARIGVSARDAVHVAVMQRHGIEEILTFDRGFDAVPGIRRLS
ncbi:MAG: type II toxin-antitoxin system VapC family toxin [Deltaproteobacteria bacterium]|nr:type II toxin-antitoxin system VapC family toxin [Deltaproteobacteria bacterium]